MKHISPIALALSVVTPSIALAADLPTVYEPEMVLRGSIEPETNSWQGFYIGGHFGYNWMNGQDDLDDGIGTTSLSSVIGGFHAGYNHMFGQFLLGVEAEGNLSDLNGQTAGGLDASNNWMIAGRVRAGYAFEHFLAYATAGVSMADASLTGTKKSSNTHTGLVVGGGLEAFVTQNISARLEYQHHWLNEQTYNTNNTDYKVDAELDIVRAGLSYHF